MSNNGTYTRPSSTWQAYIQSDAITIRGAASMTVKLGSRSHRLKVEEAEDHWLLRGTIVKNVAALMKQPLVEAATRNRRLRLCGLVVTDAGDLVGQSHVPKAGLTAAEFELHAHHLAAECDRLEHLLTSRDDE